MISQGQIHKISISSEKGMKKENLPTVELKEQHGIIGDAHAGSTRQVSLLPFESFDKIREKIDQIKPGDFAENITTIGLDFSKVAIGARLRIGLTTELEITQIGKECHHGCYIREIVGDCIMPREGIFASVITGGRINAGDKISWVKG